MYNIKDFSNKNNNFNIVIDSKNDQQRKIIIVRSIVNLKNKTDRKILIYLMSEK